MIINLATVLAVSGFIFLPVYYFCTRRLAGYNSQWYVNFLVDGQTQSIALFDFTGKIVYANKSFADLSGVTPPQLKGKSITDLPLPTSTIEALTRDNDKLIKGLSTAISFTLPIKKNAENIWVEIRKRVLVSKKLGASYILLEATNISAQKEVEERLNYTRTQYRQLVEAAGDIIYQTDLTGKILFINGVVEKILGYSEEEAQEMNIYDFVVEEEVAAFHSFLRSTYEENRTDNYQEFRVKSKNGESIWLGQMVSVIKDGDKVIGFQGVARNVSSKKLAEEKMKKAITLAEKASQAKSNFISSMSHEFRTPLNAILGYSQILNRSNSLRKEEKEHVEEIKKAGERLLNMVNDILELSTLDEQHASQQTDVLKVQSFMNQMYQRFYAQTVEKNLDFVLQYDSANDDLLEVDFDKIGLVLKNLIENAIKFTHKGAITVSYEVAKIDETNGLFHCSIIDTGIGIEERDQNKVYQPFWQKDPLKYAGTGLGLTICKRLIKVLDGKLEINSSEQGTEVQVQVPVKITSNRPLLRFQEVKNTPLPLKKTSNCRPKVLVVDDLVPNRTISRIILEENGFEYAEAEDGQEALHKLEHFDADVVLMDINMPVMDGIEATQKIRSTSWRHRDVPIIAVTAGVQSGKEELLMRGFSDYLQKPFKEEDLISTIYSRLSPKNTFPIRPIAHSSDYPSMDEQQVTPDVVAHYICTLEGKKRAKLEQILCQQDFDRLREIDQELAGDNPQIAPELKRLLEAAANFDYLFVAKVLRSIRCEKRNSVPEN